MGQESVKKTTSTKIESHRHRDTRKDIPTEAWSDEVREVMNMSRRIAAIILLQPQLDENYRAIKETAFDWSSVGENIRE